VLLAQPDLIVMDEPTNNLDAEARALVSATLARWRGGAVVASHDRALLGQVDRIVEITGLGVRVYGGGFDLYQARKAEEEAAATRDLAGAERAAAAAARVAQTAREKKARRDGAGRRFAASGSAPKILLGMMAERAETSGGREQRLAEKQAEAAGAAVAEAQARVERPRRLAFDLPPTGLPAGRRVLTLDEVTFGHPGAAPLIEGLSLQVMGPERLALCGPNGVGKSSLVRLMLGELAPSSGRVLLEVRPAILDQHAAILRSGETVFQAYRRLNPDAGENAARAALARFLFRNTAADSPVNGLSGGERLRAALACTLDAPTPPQLLILDEPTNHLDLDSIAALEGALRGYDGALVVISHDEDFLRAIEVERRINLGRA
jgi:ATPase subunit of ABC transporter with duplicated ATPase domains